MELLHKAIDFQVRQVGNPEDRVLEFIGSTADVDRYGDIIEVEGWDLKHYRENPQFLWAHNYSVPPVGTARKVVQTEKGLLFRVYFYTDEEINAKGWPANVPTPETVYRLYQIGSLKATSVGFQGLETEPILGDPDDQGYRPRTGTRYKRQDLYELSAVPVPANPYALMQAVQKGVIPEEQALLFQTPEPPAEVATGDEKTGGDDLIADLRKKVADLEAELAEAKAQPPVPLKMSLVLDEKQLEAIRQEVAKQFDFDALAKAGAVLSAKNKTALKNAQAMIQQVLDAAEPASDEGDSKEVPKPESIYSLALNPGIEPEGERLAGECEIDLAEIRNLTQNLHTSMCPGK